MTATVHNSGGQHGVAKPVAVPPKAGEPGSSVNGGELLFLALATCYTNDLYREAAARGIEATSVSVEVEGAFGGPGEPAASVRYHAGSRPAPAARPSGT